MDDTKINSNYSILIDDLFKNGFTIQPDVFSDEYCDQLGERLDSLINDPTPNTVQRKISERQHFIYNLHYADPKIFLNLIDYPQIHSFVKEALNDRIILSNFNASLALKNELNQYRIHIDSRKPQPSPKNSYSIVANICIDNFTSTNGGTVVVPNSHLEERDPRQFPPDPSGLKPISAKKGSVVYILGQTWHDIGNNIDGNRRWSIIAYYSSWWVKPTYDFVNSIEESVFTKLNNNQKELLGFTSMPPANWKNRYLTLIDPEQVSSNLDQAKKAYNL